LHAGFDARTFSASGADAFARGLAALDAILLDIAGQRTEARGEHIVQRLLASPAGGFLEDPVSFLKPRGSARILTSTSPRQP
jgi:hypothetical protein